MPNRKTLWEISGWPCLYGDGRRPAPEINCDDDANAVIDGCIDAHYKGRFQEIYKKYAR